MESSTTSMLTNEFSTLGDPDPDSRWSFLHLLYMI